MGVCQSFPVYSEATIMMETVETYCSTLSEKKMKALQKQLKQQIQMLNVAWGFEWFQ